MSDKPMAHFTLDGRPICECNALAYGERFEAAGSPPCEDAFVKQSGRLPMLQRQFPQRILLVTGPCPVVKESAHGRPSKPESATLDIARIAAYLRNEFNATAHERRRAATHFAEGLHIVYSGFSRAAFLRACGVQS